MSSQPESRTADKLAAASHELEQRLAWWDDAGLLGRDERGECAPDSLHRIRLLQHAERRGISDEDLAAVTKQQGDLLDIFDDLATTPLAAEPTGRPRNVAEVDRMPITIAHIETPRAERYLNQLCDHLGHMRGRHFSRLRHGGGHGSPPQVRLIDRNDGHAEIEFDWGRCKLSASGTGLVVQLEASNEEDLSLGQDLIARRIETIGHRDRLGVAWEPADKA